jgi:sulfite exporter TauE/SafE
MNVWSGVARIEQLGKFLWKRLQPLTRRLLPMDTPSKALMLGGLWGWVPCAMVYSVLFSAMLSGSAASGASIMLAFGLGTLPMLLGMSLLGLRLRALANSSVRFGGGVIVAGFGLLGLWRAFAGLPAWLDLLCLTPGMH